MILAVFSALLAAALISGSLTALLVRLGHRVKLLDSAGSAGHVKRELRPVPNVGGVAIFAGVWVPMAGILLLVTLGGEHVWSWIPSEAAGLRDRFLESSGLAWALLGGAMTLHVVGLIDDRRALGPFVKLVVQIVVAAALALVFDVRLLALLGPVPSVLITIAWFVVITNAMNFLDNMDGLAGGVGLIIALLLMAAALVNLQWFVASALALLAGGLAGFLIFNFPPARIFMGDGGSLVLGFLLAALSARMTWFNPDQTQYAIGSAWYGLFMPLVLFAIPLYDFTTVTVLRLRQGKSPFVGDHQHFSHRLVERGLSRRGAVLVIWGATLITGAGGVTLGRLLWWQAILVGVQTLIVLLVIAMLEHASRHSGRRSRLGTEVAPRGSTRAK